MSATKKWMIIAGVFLGCGLAFMALGMGLLGFDFTKLSADGKPITNSHTVTEDYTKISIDTSTANIRFGISDDGTTKVECKETERRLHTVTVAGDTLQIKEVSHRKWYDFIGFGVSKMELTILLPKQEMDQLTIDTSTGDITLQDMKIKGELKFNTSTGNAKFSNVTADSLAMDSSTGDFKFSDVTAKSLKLDTSTGDIEMNGVKLESALTIETNTGDVKVLDSDAASVKIETDTGDIHCRFLTEKNVKADSDTGKIRLAEDKTRSGGECILKTDTGDIIVE